MPLLALSGLIVSNQTIEQVGIARFSLVAILWALPLLLPFLDLGLGAAVTNEVAGRSTLDARARLTISRAIRLQSAVAAMGGCVAVVLTATNSWAAILGIHVPGENRCCLLFALLYLLTVPSSIGLRVLVALGRTSWTVCAQCCGALSMIVLALFFRYMHASYIGFAAVVPIGLLVSNVAANFVVRRFTGFGYWHLAIRERPGREVRVSSQAWPMFVIVCSNAVAFQADRLIVSHLMNSMAVAQYSLFAQVYAPLASVISVAGIALWPHFARAREADEPVIVRDVVRLGLVYTACGVVLGVGFAVFSGPTVSAVANGDVDATVGLAMWFGVLLIPLAAQQPVGMFLTDVAGLRMQATLSILSALANVMLSVLLVPKIGVTAPVVASVVTFSALVTVPCYIRALKHAGRDVTAPVLSGIG